MVVVREDEEEDGGGDEEEDVGERTWPQAAPLLPRSSSSIVQSWLTGGCGGASFLQAFLFCCPGIKRTFFGGFFKESEAYLVDSTESATYRPLSTVSTKLLWTCNHRAKGNLKITTQHLTTMKEETHSLEPQNEHGCVDHNCFVLTTVIFVHFVVRISNKLESIPV